MFRKILIANRGEIAVRILRACREMRIPAVAVFSDVDRAALHVRMAGEAVHLGPPPASESYLNIGRILDAARRTGADAIHPGYGFLSENPEFAAACARAGVKFIGPSAASMDLMGSKTRSRQAMKEAGVPVVPGSTQPLSGPEEALRFAGGIGYPVMLKASAGGGGKGMRRVSSPEDLPSALRQAQAEAQGAFGDPAVYMEKNLVSPRHIEVQVFGDEHGNAVHVFERECSLQRRHQKVVEESPSPLVERYPELREKITSAAVRAAQAAGYFNAGTVEFLVDANCNFYFLEMNTRLQVEHPVTELVCRADLVREQIRVAAGEKLSFRQEDLRAAGHAIECRVYAEDPDNNFLPSPGRITRLREPSGPGVRVDSGAYEGWTVPLEYDPLIAKLVAWAPGREEAIARLQGAVREYHVGGIKTTLGFFQSVLRNEEFRRGEIDTEFIDRWLERAEQAPVRQAETDRRVAALAAGLHFRRNAQRRKFPSNHQRASAWKLAGKQLMLR